MGKKEKDIPFRKVITDSTLLSNNFQEEEKNKVIIAIYALLGVKGITKISLFHPITTCTVRYNMPCLEVIGANRMVLYDLCSVNDKTILISNQMKLKTLKLIYDMVVKERYGIMKYGKVED